jgi:hypothetical protein
VETPRARRTTRHTNPLSPGAAYSDYREARERFFETLRRESELYRLEAAWKLSAPPNAMTRGER